MLRVPTSHTSSLSQRSFCATRSAAAHLLEALPAPVATVCVCFWSW